MPSRQNHLSSSPSPRYATRAARAAAIIAVWLLGSLPAITGVTRCPSALWFHHACPGCGMTRAMWLLARGDLHGSLAMHPLAVPSALTTSFVVLAVALVVLRTGTLAEVTRDRVARVAFVAWLGVDAALVALWIARSFGALGGLPPV